MKVSILSENLKEKLIFVSHGISTHTQLPILLNFLIEAKNGELSITSTDLEIGIRVNTPAKIEEEGEVTVPAKTFTELISNISSKKIVLSSTKEGLGMVAEKTKTMFQTTSSEDFPKIYTELGEEATIINKEMIEKELPKIVFAASLDMGRPALSGVLIKETEGKLVVVATDGFRLSLKKHEGLNRKKTKEDMFFLVPSRVLRELILMSKEEGGVKIYAPKESNQIIFKQNDTVLVGRLIEAEFPSYEKIIPQNSSTKTMFDKEEMQKAIKTCHIFARESANIIKMSIQENRVVVSSGSPSVGQNLVEVDAKTEGEDVEIAFNARYLLDFFSSVSAETILLETNGPLNPGVFKIDKDNSFLHLIMPIRVQEEH